MHTGEEKLAREGLVGRKIVERATLFIHPGFAPPEINRPKREIGRFGREIDAIFPLAQCLQHLASLFDQGGDKQQG